MLIFAAFNKNSHPKVNDFRHFFIPGFTVLRGWEAKVELENKDHVVAQP